jgi:hypothetical protein
MTRRPEEDGGGGLCRWSRRKLAARRSGAVPREEAEAGEMPSGTAAAADADRDEVDAEYIAALPPIETIGDGCDIKPFLARGVPESLRNAALRRLWSATPGVRDYSDPAVDYAWDWNAPGGVPGGGGALTESGVGKMVRDLIGASRPDDADDNPASVAEESGKTDAVPEPEEAAAERRAHDTGAASDAVRRVARREPEADDSPDRPPGAHGARAPAGPVAQRRHGGAVPD